MTRPVAEPDQRPARAPSSALTSSGHHPDTTSWAVEIANDNQRRHDWQQPCPILLARRIDRTSKMVVT